MTSTPVFAALALVGFSALGSGLAMVWSRRGGWPGALMGVSGTLLLLVAAILASGHPGSGDVAWRAATVVAALAGLSYPRPRWRDPVSWVVAVLAVGTVPFGLPLAQLATSGGDTAGTVVVAAVGLHLWWRMEHEPADLWALACFATVLVVLLAACGAVLMDGDAGPAGALLIGGVASLVPPTLHVAAAPRDTLDLRSLVVTAVVGATVVVTGVAGWLVLVSGLELLDLPPRPVGYTLVGVALGLAARPLWVVLRGVIDELLFGRRPDPLTAASRLSVDLGDADQLGALACIREALVLPYAALVTSSGTVSSGAATTHTRTVELHAAGSVVGHLVVGLRPGHLALGPDDHAVLRLVTPLLAQAVHGQQLLVELQTSRHATITALEDERRRLRRDLHDGLGARLSGIAFTADAVHNTMGHDPAEAARALELVRAEASEAIAEIRRLVEGMRPPALDELGLVEALRQQAETVRGPRGTLLAVAIEAEELPPLPAAVEVAAYRIVVEALNNTARHSGRGRARIRIGMEVGSLALAVEDGGVGGWVPGVGISSMQERAAELGGTLVAGAGTVRASLPLPADP